ncbi:OTU domain-containing protein 3 isoform X1 [Octopus sinensis]|uniref:OTU domain-containing protein 3 isoform X1 n=1 Tax=Octopus sinensis TaxID=2607531 RepID=A0A6P7TQ89_9MOLL|nr:OTU domain-containing protein 3 isoform X1 [Octopus sinensis]
MSTCLCFCLPVSTSTIYFNSSTTTTTTSTGTGSQSDSSITATAAGDSDSPLVSATESNSKHKSNKSLKQQQQQQQQQQLSKKKPPKRHPPPSHPPPPPPDLSIGGGAKWSQHSLTCVAAGTNNPHRDSNKASNNQGPLTSKKNKTNSSPSVSTSTDSIASSSVTTTTTTITTSSESVTSPGWSSGCWKPLSIMARKRDDKSPARNCGGDRQERKMESYLADDENYPSFSNQVVKLGLQLRDIPADGNCLFRALGDQLEGHGRNHYCHRLKVVEYMLKNKKDFAPFVEDNIQFEHYLYNLKKPGTYAGNDAIAAFGRLHQVHIVIHQLNSPFLLIQGSKDVTAAQLHIAYHNGDHYSSLRWLHDNTESPANIRLKIFSDDKSKLKNKINPKTIYRDEKSGVVRAVRDLKSIQQEIIGATGCQDREVIRKYLEENDYNVDATVADLLQLLNISRKEEKSVHGKKTALGKSDSCLWSETGSGSRLFGTLAQNSSSATSSTSSPPSLSSSSTSLRKSKDSRVHFTDDCTSESSGYGSLSGDSSSSSGARPKHMIPRVRVL